MDFKDLAIAGLGGYIILKGIKSDFMDLFKPKVPDDLAALIKSLTGDTIPDDTVITLLGEQEKILKATGLLPEDVPLLYTPLILQKIQDEIKDISIPDVGLPDTGLFVIDDIIKGLIPDTVKGWLPDWLGGTPDIEPPLTEPTYEGLFKDDPFDPFDPIVSIPNLIPADDIYAVISRYRSKDWEHDRTAHADARTILSYFGVYVRSNTTTRGLRQLTEETIAGMGNPGVATVGEMAGTTIGLDYTHPNYL